MPYCFGSHVSCQGGLLKGIDRAVEVGCDCMQIFVSNPRQWPSVESHIPVSLLTKNHNQGNCKPNGDAEAAEFILRVEKNRLQSTIAHTSYLINLATPDDLLWRKSLDALVVEWRRAEQLHLVGLVVHPGACMTSTPEQGLERVARAVSEAASAVNPKYSRLLLENTAGQGSSLGWQFEQLGFLLSETQHTKHVGICFDTCHALAAGYDFRTATGLKKMCQEFESAIGFENLLALHLNDSKKGCGSRVDRHEHIGKGEIGEAAFTRLLKSKSFKYLPMYLETEKGIDESTGEDWDKQNLATLRRLANVKLKRL